MATQSLKKKKKINTSKQEMKAKTEHTAGQHILVILLVYGSFFAMADIHSCSSIEITKN